MNQLLRALELALGTLNDDLRKQALDLYVAVSKAQERQPMVYVPTTDRYVYVSQDDLDYIKSIVGTHRIQAIKSVREVTGLGLREAKSIIDHRHPSPHWS